MLKVKAKGVGHDSIAKNRLDLNRFVAFASRHTKFYPCEIDEVFALRYAETWQAQYPSASTRRLVRDRFNRFCAFCVKFGGMVSAPEIPIVKVLRDPTLPITDREFERLLLAASKGQLPVRSAVTREVRRAVVLLMRWSGAAIYDATMMKRESIFFDDAKGVYRCRYRRKKTGTLVNNPLPREVAESILAVGGTCSSPVYLFQEEGKEGVGSGSKRSWTDWFHEAFVRAGMPKGHSHQLRDTFAVGLLLKGVPLESVSKALGHESIKVTERYYAPWVQARQDLLDTVLLTAMEHG